jgi:hypothetical protein
MVAGGVLMYELIVALTTNEEEEFHRVGHLDGLAREVAWEESKYTDRILLPQNRDEKIEFVNAI